MERPFSDWPEATFKDREYGDVVVRPTIPGTKLTIANEEAMTLTMPQAIALRGYLNRMLPFPIEIDDAEAPVDQAHWVIEMINGELRVTAWNDARSVRESIVISRTGVRLQAAV